MKSLFTVASLLVSLNVFASTYSESTPHYIVSLSEKGVSADIQEKLLTNCQVELIAKSKSISAKGAIVLDSEACTVGAYRGINDDQTIVTGKVFFK